VMKTSPSDNRPKMMARSGTKALRIQMAPPGDGVRPQAEIGEIERSEEQERRTTIEDSKAHAEASFVSLRGHWCPAVDTVERIPESGRRLLPCRLEPVTS
jgi:hypothetical protein